jgi:hypothetical protein
VRQGLCGDQVRNATALQIKSMLEFHRYAHLSACSGVFFVRNSCQKDGKRVLRAKHRTQYVCRYQAVYVLRYARAHIFTKRLSRSHETETQCQNFICSLFHRFSV